MKNSNSHITKAIDLDAMFVALENDAIEETRQLGIDQDAPCWSVVVEAVYRRTYAVRRMIAVEPFSPEWMRLSERICAAEMIIYSHAQP